MLSIKNLNKFNYDNLTIENYIKKIKKYTREELNLFISINGLTSQMSFDGEASTYNKIKDHLNLIDLKLRLIEIVGDILN